MGRKQFTALLRVCDALVQQSTGLRQQSLHPCTPEQPSSAGKRQLEEPAAALQGAASLLTPTWELQVCRKAGRAALHESGRENASCQP